MATLIHEDGTLETVVPGDGTSFTLDEMYRIIGCELVERITTHPYGLDLWFDEEGKTKPHERNVVATRMLTDAGGILGDYIAGRALLTSRGEVA